VNHIEAHVNNNSEIVCPIPNHQEAARIELSPEEKREIQRHNVEVRSLAYKEVRRPGKGKCVKNICLILPNSL
jgi:hypothetical protein